MGNFFNRLFGSKKVPRRFVSTAEWQAEVEAFESEQHFPILIHLEGKTGFAKGMAFFEVWKLYKAEVQKTEHAYRTFFEKGGTEKIVPTHEQLQKNVSWFVSRLVDLPPILKAEMNEDEYQRIFGNSMSVMLEGLSQSDFFMNHLTEFRVYRTYFERMENLFGTDTAQYASYTAFAARFTKVNDMDDAELREWAKNNKQ